MFRMETEIEIESKTQNIEKDGEKALNEIVDKANEDENIVIKPKSDFDGEEYRYLKNGSGFSSEVFKIEVKNLPKYYGYGEIKKLINTTLGLECNKIKIPRKNSSFGFICMKNDEGMLKFIFAFHLMTGF